MIPLPFTVNDLEAQFDQRSLERGRSYWREGMVKHLYITDNGCVLRGKVQGTRRQPYEVKVTITPKKFHDAGVAVLNIDAVCSCPVVDQCKHAAALCFRALFDPNIRQRDPDPIAPNDPIVDAMLSQMPVESAIELVRTTLRDLQSRLQTQTQPPSPPPLAPWETWLNDLTHSCDRITENRKPREIVVYLLEIGSHSVGTMSHYLRIRTTVSKVLKTGGYDTPRSITPYELRRKSVQYITPDDLLIAKLLQDNTTEFRTSSVDAGMLDIIMHRILETGRCFFQKCEGTPLSLGEQKHAKLGWRTEPDGSQVPTIVPEDESIPLVILPTAPPWYIEHSTRQVGPLKVGVPPSVLQKFLSGPKLLPDAVTSVAERMAESQSFSGIIVPPKKIRLEKRPLAPPIPCLRLAMHTTQPYWSDREKTYPIALVHFEYDGIPVEPSTPDTLRKQTKDWIIHITRDRPSEGALLAALSHTGLVRYENPDRPQDVPANRLAYHAPNQLEERVQWLRIVHRIVPELRADGWRVEMDKDFANTFRTLELDDVEAPWEADLREEEGRAAWWFSLDLGILIENQRVPLLPLLVQAIKRLKEPTTAAIEGLALSGQLYVDLPDGRALALPFERVRDILTTLVELYDRPLDPDGTMLVSLDLISALSRIDAATKMRWLGGERLRALLDRLKTFTGLAEIAPPSGLTATLRPYQREGLNWLQFLRDYRLSGVLADDMGLGKTVQALAHIMTEKESGRLDSPCLIVCPTSLIPNWQDEAKKFTPALRVLSLHGKERATRFAEIGNADLVLTTYPLLPRDAETLLATEWYLIVLDESQVIKNPIAKVTQLACELKAQHRLCLTGTPIENHLGEAWSQFAFLMPGMLGSYRDFTKHFRNPIEKMKDTERQSVLSRRLKPFVLRRNKSEVAKDLPPKTEIVHIVEFGGPQRDLYETLRLTMHDKVQQAVSEKGFNRSQIVILDALLKLRQVCCDPRLVKLSKSRKITQSAKLESLMEMLPEMIEEGSKILLFSQFTSMLDLIKPELIKAGIPFVEIRGDTKDRKTPVTTFQNGEVPLFLISLKAGGTGLNLTAADTVIHYDPWWNPAVENQATDRAHRIGQEKPVFVYKFIARGSVEERILELQNRKRFLASALLEERTDAAAAFEADDLDFLFREPAWQEGA